MRLPMAFEIGVEGEPEEIHGCQAHSRKQAEERAKHRTCDGQAGEAENHASEQAKNHHQGATLSTLESSRVCESELNRQQIAHANCGDYPVTQSQHNGVTYEKQCNITGCARHDTKRPSLATQQVIGQIAASKGIKCHPKQAYFRDELMGKSNHAVHK